MATLSTNDITSMAKGDIEAKERIWLNADRTEAVAEGSPDAEVLLAGEGGMISAADAEKYGISDDGKAPGKKSSSKKSSSSDESDKIASRSTKTVSADSKK